MIVFSGTVKQCNQMVIDLQRSGLDAILGSERTSVTVFERRDRWYSWML